MIRRTVRAENMLAALEIVKKELGPDALVVSVRQVLAGPSWQVWRKPLVEVVAVQEDKKEKPEKPEKKLSPEAEIIFATEKEETPEIEFEEASSQRKQGFQVRGYQQSSAPQKEVEGMSQNAEVLLQETLEDTHPVKVTLPSIPAEIHPEKYKTFTPERITKEGVPLQIPENQNALLNKISQFLSEQGLNEILIKQINKSCIDILPQPALQDLSRLRECVQQQLESCIRAQNETGEEIPKIIFVVGMSGGGKTSFCAKLALRLSTDLGKKVAWISADTVRIGAIAETRTYTDMIGISLCPVYTPEELVTAVDNFETEYDHILIDTPAYNPKNEAEIKELGQFIEAVSGQNIWVVLPATAKEKDLMSSLTVLNGYHPRGVVITKLDETGNFSAVFNIAWKSQLPIIYFTFGKRVLNDVIPARTAPIVRALFEDRFVL